MPADRIAFVGNSLPRRCGIATFTTDLQQAIAASIPPVITSIIAMTDGDRTYNYPPSVGCEVRHDVLSDYVAAAAYINAGGFDAVCLLVTWFVYTRRSFLIGRVPSLADAGV